MISVIRELSKDFGFILVSKSPRRRQLLQELGLNFIVAPRETPEKIRNWIYRWDIVKATKEKLDAGPDDKNKILIACDTIVVYNQNVFGKPKDSKQATYYLETLSGKMHRVLSCIALKVITAGQVRYYHAVETSKVYFRKLDPVEIAEYVQTPEPYDKAGGYGAQRSTMAFVKKINGCYYNVIGLPLFRLLELLKQVKGASENGILQ